MSYNLEWKEYFISIVIRHANASESRRFDADTTKAEIVDKQQALDDRVASNHPVQLALQNADKFKCELL